MNASSQAIAKANMKETTVYSTVLHIATVTISGHIARHVGPSRRPLARAPRSMTTPAAASAAARTAARAASRERRRRLLSTMGWSPRREVGVVGLLVVATVVHVGQGPVHLCDQAGVGLLEGEAVGLVGVEGLGHDEGPWLPRVVRVSGVDREVLQQGVDVALLQGGVHLGVAGEGDDVGAIRVLPGVDLPGGPGLDADLLADQPVDVGDLGILRDEQRLLG